MIGTPVFELAVVLLTSVVLMLDRRFNADMEVERYTSERQKAHYRAYTYCKLLLRVSLMVNIIAVLTVFAKRARLHP